MKKNIIYTFFVSLLLLLTACGSNNIEDPVNTSTIEEVDGYAFTETDETLLIDSYKSYVIKFKLVEDGFAVVGQTVLFKNFDSEFGTIETSSVITDENGLGSFTYNPPSTMPASGTSKIIRYVYRYTDEEGESEDLIQNITLNFNFDSNDGGNGRATTLSINYMTSTCDATKGLIGHYNVHAVDERSNSPVVGMDVEFSLINSVKKIKGVAVQRGSGNIKNSASLTFADSRLSFVNEDITVNDNLIILPTQDASEIPYLGGWNINDVGKELTLFGNYNNIDDTNNLTYIIGNEKRLLGGENGSAGTLTAAHVMVINGITDSKGFAYFDLVFDSKLAGHTVVLEAHGDENGKRYGIAKKAFLRLPGDNFTARDVEINNTGGVYTIHVPITIAPSCAGTESLVDVPISPSSFTVEPKRNCMVVGGDFLTNSSGAVKVDVLTDGNITASEICTLSWEGGPESLRSEY